MKLSDIEEVKVWVEKLAEAEGAILKIQSGAKQHVIVTIDGIPLDELSDEVRPLAVRHFQLRVAAYKQQLVTLGVEVDG